MFSAPWALVPTVATTSATFSLNAGEFSVPFSLTMVTVTGAPFATHAVPSDTASPVTARLRDSTFDYSLTFGVTDGANGSWVRPSFFLSTNTEFAMVHRVKGLGPRFLVTTHAQSHSSLATTSNDPAVSGTKDPFSVSTSVSVVWRSVPGEPALLVHRGVFALPYCIILQVAIWGHLGIVARGLWGALANFGQYPHYVEYCCGIFNVCGQTIFDR